MAKEDFQRQGGAQSIRRAIALLRSVTKYNDQGAPLSKIARDINLPTTTAHRMLAVMVEEGFITYDPASKLYHLGIELYTLGSAAHQFNIRDVFHAIIERISDETGDTTHLAIRSGNDGLCIDRIVGKFPVQVLTFEVGERRPLGIGATSRVLLASLPDDQVETIITANTMHYAKYCSMKTEEIWAFVKRIRDVGYSISDRQFSPDAVGVGVPVRNKKGEVVAAISVAGISRRMGRERCKEIAHLIKSEIGAIDYPPG